MKSFLFALTYVTRFRDLVFRTGGLFIVVYVLSAVLGWLQGHYFPENPVISDWGVNILASAWYVIAISAIFGYLYHGIYRHFIKETAR